MRSRGWVVLLTTLIAVVLSADGCALLFVAGKGESETVAPPAAAHRAADGPEQVAGDYFAAWERGDLAGMRSLVADPPVDFVQQHEALSGMLHVSSVRFDPGPVARQGNEARVDFTVTRDLTGIGTWSYRSALTLGLARGRWLVMWSPATLHPRLEPGGVWTLTKTGAAGDRLVDRNGRPLPANTTARPYLDELTKNFVGPGQDRPGWIIGLRNGRDAERLKTFREKRAKRTRTTLDRNIQTAADKAIETADGPAAIVAVRPSSGEILAVADGLGGRNAFLGLYPPGSAFKVVTAAALLRAGLGEGTAVDCPDTVHIGPRTIDNHDGLGLGRTSLRTAFARSCNTTFARLAVDRVGADGLAATAKEFGFEGPLTPGVPAARGGFPAPTGTADLAEAAFGQGRVLASPLTMALVAAAAANGTWRPPRLVAAKLIKSAANRRSQRTPSGGRAPSAP